MSLTLSGSDLRLVLLLALVIVAGWILVVGGLFLAEWVVYELIAAVAIQLVLHTGPTPGLAFPLVLASLSLTTCALILYGLTLHQWTALAATRRYLEINWRDVASLALWIAGAETLLMVIHPLLGLALLVAVCGWIWFSLRPEGRAIRLHVSIELRCDPADAFALVGEPRNWPQFVDGLEVEDAGNGPVGVGSRFRMRLRRKDTTIEAFEEITELRPGRVITSKVLGRPGTSGSNTIELAPLGTRLIYDFESVLSVPQSLLGLKRGIIVKLKRQREEIFHRIKTLLETPPDPRTLEPAG